jgi:hypothetical protein
MESAAHAWKAVLDAYSYPVDLREYRFRAGHQGWFERNTGNGRREATIAFEEIFRRHAPNALESWFEVVFWKLATQRLVRNGTTHRIEEHLSKHTTAGELWDTCIEYVQSRTESEAQERFERFHKLFGMKTDSIATVATFPAFVDPERFVMVDTRIANWVGAEMHAHNINDPSGVQLVRPRFLDSTNTVLKMSDLDFMCTWAKWCRRTAEKLTLLTDGFTWRARDVEMAVFRAWGEKSVKQHPELNLPPVPSQ